LRTWLDGCEAQEGARIDCFIRGQSAEGAASDGE